MGGFLSRRALTKRYPEELSTAKDRSTSPYFSSSSVAFVMLASAGVLYLPHRAFTVIVHSAHAFVLGRQSLLRVYSCRVQSNLARASAFALRRNSAVAYLLANLFEAQYRYCISIRAPADAQSSRASTGESNLIQLLWLPIPLRPGCCAWQVC